MWWLTASQAGRVSLGAFLGSVWMAGLAISPYLLKRAIDDGLERHDRGALALWAGALLAVGLANAYVGIMRHRTMSRIRMDAGFRTVRAVIAHATHLGAELPRRVSGGEVVTIGMSDVTTIAQMLTVTGPGVGSVVAYTIVAVILLSISPLLGAVVLAGVPALALTMGPLLRRLQATAGDYRQHQAALTGRLIDIIAGLRVLAGLGGRDAYADRYRTASARLRGEGYRVGAVTSWVTALGVGLPALFLAVVTWLAARMAVAGTISAGDLVAVYGYAAVLTDPVAFFVESGGDFARALPAARRTVALLAIAPAASDAPDAVDAPAGPSVLEDPASGVRLAPGELAALVTARPGDATAIVDRLGRYADSDATWGGIRLDRIRLAQVRARVLVADNEAELFAGPLRDAVAGRGAHGDDAIGAAIRAAAAEDIVSGLSDGLAADLTHGARNLSGGQRQRIRMARALVGEPEVLLAVEPTSAVDTHTEAAMADRLRRARAGRTTLVTTSSPLLLDRADRVFLVVNGRTVASGPHQELLARPDYRALVLRGSADEPADDPAAPADAEPAGEIR